MSVVVIPPEFSDLTLLKGKCNCHDSGTNCLHAYATGFQAVLALGKEWFMQVFDHLWQAGHFPRRWTSHCKKAIEKLLNNRPDSITWSGTNMRPKAQLEVFEGPFRVVLTAKYRAHRENNTVALRPINDTTQPGQLTISTGTGSIELRAVEFNALGYLTLMNTGES